MDRLWNWRVIGGLLLVAVIAGLLVFRGEQGEQGAAERSDGWLVTVYYTAVESNYDDDKVEVTGCLSLDCEYGDEDLGSYPDGFVTAVQDEGTGRIVSGRHAGKYLNWSHDVGYWLDTAARDSHGRPLEPFVSAATDPAVLKAGRQLRISGCGKAEDGSQIEPEVCERLKAASWQIRDEFTPGLGGERHLDVYLGEESGPDFTSSSLYTALYGATLELSKPVSQ
ncbi:hypothetical protein [Amycolatopsis nigrescens]|uniref:hypothetical protein n=1 Tax=Amycolatopsis nigrescens TaxID=381445 RepID=UPI000361276D|nr:hypothetical protein [Amycolatopsis nigrescens]